MEFYLKENIIDFLTSRNWEIIREGNKFLYLKNNSLGLPEDFELEIPKEDKNVAFNNYIERIINEIKYINKNENSIEDIKLLFSKKSSIIKFRVYDNENLNGTIGFENYIESLEFLKKSLSQTVGFVVTKKHIFADAKTETEAYLKHCRTLQTEVGSFITKLEVPNEEIYTTVSLINSEKINNKFLDTINFVSEEIINPKHKVEITENYLSDYSEFINYELLYSIKDIYNKTQFNNIEYQLLSNKLFRKVNTEKVQSRITFFNQYLRELKKMLLKNISVEIVGKVNKLSSLSPLSSNNNEIFLTTYVNYQKEKIKLILKSDQYLEAIDAHKNEKYIKVKGIARQGKTYLSISEIESFQIIS